jgi:hypothetical protein
MAAGLYALQQELISSPQPRRTTSLTTGTPFEVIHGERAA